MNYNDLFSRAERRTKASAIRELLKVTAMPEIISFAGGLPAPELFPTKDVEEILQDVMKHHSREALQYGTTEGQKRLKTEIIKLMKAENNIDVQPENILVVSAAQQALDMTARMFINEGDPIIAPRPTYLGALQAFQAAGADMIGAESDEGGVIPADIEKKLEMLKAQGRRCKLIYVVPDFQNPSGTTVSEERRKQILALAEKYDTFILEDSPYRQVRFEGKAPRMFYELDNGQGRVLTTFTFSKVFVPGFRLGFIIGPKEVIAKYVILKQAMDLCTSPFLQLVTAEYLRRGLLAAHIQEMIACYKAKRDVMLDCLKKYMPAGVTWTHPEGGLFLWLTLPKHLNASELLKKAIEYKVAFVAGVDFYPECNVYNDMRLNFSYSSHEQIEEGIKRLAQMIQENL